MASRLLVLLALAAAASAQTSNPAPLGGKCGTWIGQPLDVPCAAGLKCIFPSSQLCIPQTQQQQQRQVLCANDQTAKQLSCPQGQVCVSLPQTTFGGTCVVPIVAPSASAPAPGLSGFLPVPTNPSGNGGEAIAVHGHGALAAAALALVAAL
ncbi:hypothetical protein HK105_206067 [Polyrhizophydium stewartii]|uniref:Uncharacterized protein n=1 Tax=Polyrhizophydium stewartii TaxID=2732419 RepID=A0ABR4N4R8_9FUNG